MNRIADPSTTITRIPSATRRWILLAAPLLMLFAAHLLTSGRLTASPQSADQAKPLAADAPDDWRRTADGWERTHSWPTAAFSSWQLFRPRDLSPSKSSAPSRAATRAPRLDTHPAVLALAQLIASVLALTIFRDPQHNPLRLSSLLTTISHSFRSSAFGS